MLGGVAVNLWLGQAHPAIPLVNFLGGLGMVILIVAYFVRKSRSRKITSPPNNKGCIAAKRSGASNYAVG